jgi:imidazolonepropionase-like amidohydrolase
MMKTLIHNCHLLDVEQKKMFEHAQVVIEDGVIRQISEAATQKVPMNAVDEVIDCEGKYLVPGLINLHVHIQRRHLHKPGKGVFRQGAAILENSSDMRRMVFALRNGLDELRHGVTTIRDCSSKARLNNEYRDCVKDRLLEGPAVVSCGLGIAGTGGHETHRYPGAVQADGPDEVRKAVREEIRQGADFIKFMGSGGLGGLPEHEHPYWVELSFEELQVGIAEAHNRMKTCTVHAMGERSVDIAIRAGMDGIEHGTNLNDKLIDAMLERQVYYIPTMSGIAAVAQREFDNGSKDLAAFIRKLVVDPQHESVALAHRKGVLIGAGTDTLGDLITELSMFVECGMTPMEALMSATINAARILGKQETIGSITVGKQADLVLVANNPLESVEHLRSIAWVMKGGTLVSQA